MILSEIKDALLDHIIFSGDNETDYIYDERACAEVKSILDSHHVENSVFFYPTGSEDPHTADYWCAITWVGAGQLHTYGFNWMSAQREQLLTEEVEQYTMEELFNANA